MKTRSTGLLAGMAGATGLALTLLAAAALLGGTARPVLLATAAGPVLVAAGLWFLHRRRTATACAPKVRASGCGGSCQCALTRTATG